MIRVEHLFISPGHNFFGHHGQPAGEHPTLSVEEIECVAGRGIRGDRFYGSQRSRLQHGDVSSDMWAGIALPGQVH